MLRAAWLTILLSLSEEAASNINSSLLFCRKYTFQKVGSRSPLCNVCYSKNKYEDGEAAPRTNPLTLNISFSTEKPRYPFVVRPSWTNAGKHRKRRISPPLQLWAHIMAVKTKKINSNIIPTGYNKLPSCLNWIEFDLQWRFEALINDQ